MGCAPDDVLAGKEPVAPSEAAHMVENLQEKNGSLRVLDRVLLDSDFLGLLTNVSQELSVREWAVCTEFVKNLREGGRGHGDLAEVIQKGNLE